MGVLSILFSEFWQPCRLHNMTLVSKIVKSEIKLYDLGIKIVECGNEIWCFLWSNLQASMGSVCWSLDLRQGWALGLDFGNVETIGKSEDVLFLLLKWKEVSKVHKLVSFNPYTFKFKNFFTLESTGEKLNLNLTFKSLEFWTLQLS
jgi:hypothetical protein